MTDIISTDRFTICRTGTPRRAKPKPVLVNAVLAMISAMAQAFSMAYVEPYQRRPFADKDLDPQGRDPSW